MLKTLQLLSLINFIFIYFIIFYQTYKTRGFFLVNNNNTITFMRRILVNTVTEYVFCMTLIVIRNQIYTTLIEYKRVVSEITKVFTSVR